MDIDSDCDDDVQLQEINQLTAVIEADDAPITETSSQHSQRSSVSLSTIDSQHQHKYSKIQYALALNKLTDEKLRKLEGILINRLHECRQKLKEIEGNNSYEKQDKTFKYLNCGRPYFKDRNNFAAPENDDTILMAKSNMYDFSTVTSVPGWTVKDKSTFLSLIHKMSVNVKKDMLNSQIAQLLRETKGKSTAAVKKNVAALKKEIENLNDKQLSELALPINEDYDWDCVANKLNYRHNAQEYRALWQLFLHPSINKSTWTKNEHAQLQRVANANSYQDWEKIARELSTGRTGYQCFVYFRTNLSNSFTANKWSKEEEEYLKRLIEFYREDDYIPWSKIAAFMENRTKIQIYNKHFLLMQNRKGRFLPEEDVVLLTCVQNYGQNFKKIMKYLPGRAIAQLRTRYEVLTGTEGTKTSTVWTVDEDRKLIQFMANQDLTCNYSSIKSHFPGKTRTHIRTRYLTLLKWMKKNPNVDITRAPRRGARRLIHGEASKDLNTALEKLKSRIQTDVKNKKVSNRICSDSPEDAIETAIVATLVTEHIKEDEKRKEEMLDNESSLLAGPYNKNCNGINLKQLLVLLKAKLDKPSFQNSCYDSEYASLAHAEEYLLVKSYSRKQKIQIFGLDGPDIWGGKQLNTSDYVLPPNYATITGCRKLMSYVTAKPRNENIVLSTLLKRNVILEDQMKILMDRFKTLFLWPMLLSNEKPTCETGLYKMPTQIRNTRSREISSIRNTRSREISSSMTQGISIPVTGASIVYDNIEYDKANDTTDIVIEEILTENELTE